MYANVITYCILALIISVDEAGTETSRDINLSEYIIQLLLRQCNRLPFFTSWSIILFDYRRLPVCMIDPVCHLECSGITVPWQPGSVWTTYPYQRHAGSVGWTPIAFSQKQNKITVCADNCEGQSNQLNRSCMRCASSAMIHGKFCDFVQASS